jgi:hypothetical protein
MSHSCALCATQSERSRPNMSRHGNRAEIAIEALKHRFKVQTDAELARALKVGHSTLVSWRKRGNVPDRYLAAGPGDVGDTFTTPPMMWNDLENAAIPLALARLYRDHGHRLTDYRDFLQGGGEMVFLLWQYIALTVRDIRERSNRAFANENAREADPHIAASIIAYDEIGKPASEPLVRGLEVRIDGKPRKWRSKAETDDGT